MVDNTDEHNKGKSSKYLGTIVTNQEEIKGRMLAAVLSVRLAWELNITNQNYIPVEIKSILFRGILSVIVFLSSCLISRKESTIPRTVIWCIHIGVELGFPYGVKNTKEGEENMQT
jgi:hypothetical protein